MLRWLVDGFLFGNSVVYNIWVSCLICLMYMLVGITWVVCLG